MEVLRLYVDDNKVYVKPDNITVIYTGDSVSYNFIESGATQITVDSDNVTIYTPIIDTSSFVDNSTFIQYTGDTSASISGLTEDLQSHVEDFNSHTGDTNIHYPMSEISIQILQVDGLSLALSDKVNNAVFQSHTGDTNVHYTQDNITIQIPQVSGLTLSLNDKVSNSVYQNDMLIISNEIDSKSDTGHTHSYNDLNNKPSLDYLALTGGTITGSLHITQDLNVDGSVNTIHGEVIFSENDFIHLRENNPTSLGLNQISGIAVLKADGVNNVVLGSDNQGTMRIGWSGDTLIALAGREDSPLDGGLGIWDSASHKFNTVLPSGLTFNISQITDLQ